MKVKIANILCSIILILFLVCGCNTNVPSSTPNNSLPLTPPSSEDIPIPKVKNADWLITQSEVESQILSEMSAEYTADSPLVVVDPYKIAPLTALVIFDEEVECSVKITIPGKTPNTTFVHDFKQLQKHHEIPVYGLYAGEENLVVLDLTYADGKEKSVTIPIKTEPLPKYLPPYKVVLNNPSLIGGKDDELLYMSMASGGVHPIAIDKQGVIRWYSSDSEFSGGIFRRMSEGRFLALSNPLYAPAISRSGVVVVDRMGKVYNEYLMGLTHHDAIELPNGNLMIDTMRPGTEVLINGMMMGLDTIVEIDSKTGNTVDEWDLNYICGYRDNLGKLVFSNSNKISTMQFFHTNSVWYNDYDNSIIVSSPTMKVVVKIDMLTDEIIWAIGNPQNDYPDAIKNKILTPIGDYFEWNAMQHAAMVLPNGYIMMNDNGTGRFDDSGNLMKDSDNYSRLVVFDVNEHDMTIRQVYQYGKERGNELFATYLGDVDYLGEDHYLLNAGGRIVDDNGVAQGTAYDAQMGIRRAEAKIVEILNNDVILEVHVGDKDSNGLNNIYRVEWDSVYSSDEKEYNIANTFTHRLGNLIASQTVEFELPQKYDSLIVEASPIDYTYQLNVPVVVGGMVSNDTLLMELKSKDKSYYYQTSGMRGAQGIVRAAGLPKGEYSIGFVLIKEDRRVFYTQINQKWIVN